MKCVLPILMLGLVTTGCKKEKEHCWTCNYTYTGSGIPDKTGDTVLCNFTESDIKLRQDKKFDAGTSGYETWMMANCKQQ